jgi:hypothetical protein
MPVTKKRTSTVVKSKVQKKLKVEVEVGSIVKRKADDVIVASGPTPYRSNSSDSPPSLQIIDSVSLKSPYRSGPHASLAAADATLSFLDQIIKQHEQKSKELVWLARNKTSKVADDKKSIAKLQKLHKKESMELLAPEVDVSMFNFGFWSGVLASSRLAGGIIHAAEEATFVEGPTPSAAVMRHLALDCFPDLHV